MSLIQFAKKKNYSREIRRCEFCNIPIMPGQCYEFDRSLSICETCEAKMKEIKKAVNNGYLEMPFTIDQVKCLISLNSSTEVLGIKKAAENYQVLMNKSW